MAEWKYPNLLPVCVTGVAGDYSPGKMAADDLLREGVPRDKLIVVERGLGHYSMMAECMGAPFLQHALGQHRAKCVVLGLDGLTGIPETTDELDVCREYGVPHVLVLHPHRYVQAEGQGFVADGTCWGYRHRFSPALDHVAKLIAGSPYGVREMQFIRTRQQRARAEEARADVALPDMYGTMMGLLGEDVQLRPQVTLARAEPDATTSVVEVSAETGRVCLSALTSTACHREEDRLTVTMMDDRRVRAFTIEVTFPTSGQDEVRVFGQGNEEQPKPQVFKGFTARGLMTGAFLAYAGGGQTDPRLTDAQGMRRLHRLYRGIMTASKERAPQRVEWS